MVVSVEHITGLGFLVAGLVVGFGVVFVRPESGEPERLSKFLPGMGLYRFAIFRYVISAIGFLFASLGGAILIGWVNLG